MFYVLLEHDTNNACFVSDDDAIPQKHDTEAAAIATAKEYSGETLVLRAVARVTDVTRYKVEKIK